MLIVGENFGIGAGYGTIAMVGEMLAVGDKDNVEDCNDTVDDGKDEDSDGDDKVEDSDNKDVLLEVTDTAETSGIP